MVDVYAMAGRLLALVEEHFTSASVDLPPTRYVAPGGVVAYDEEQLTVHVSNLFPGQPPTAGAAVTDPALTLQSAEFRVTIIRDTPIVDDSGNPPSVDALQASAQEHLNDMRTMMAALEAIRASYQFVTYNIPFSILGVAPYGPEGGVVGTIGTIQVLLLEEGVVLS